MASTAFFYVPAGTAHDTGPFHPECPDRLPAIQQVFAEAAIAPSAIPVTPAARADLLRVHSAEHVDTVENICMTYRPYILDADTRMCFESWDAALLAAGCVINACKSVLDGVVSRAFCAIRPPGHHAERDHAMGFCIFNNVAVAAKWMRQQAGLKRVAILDWDVHHGNGTQHAFYEDDTVYYASIHQSPHYPGTGLPQERGKNNTNLNIPMPPGQDPAAWVEAVEKLVVPEFARFAPEFLLISAGFDAHRDDPLGHQRLEAVHFAEMTKRVLPIARGRIVSALEGGYNLDKLGGSALAHFNALQA